MKRVLRELYTLKGRGSKEAFDELKRQLGLASAAYTSADDYVKHSIVTAINNFLVASGEGVVTEKTLAQVIDLINTLPQRFGDSHDDMLGEVRSSILGGTAWDVEVITGTAFVVGALRNNSSDLVQVKIQVPHRRKLQSILDSIHIHYELQAESVLNDTIVFSGSYCWVQPGEAVPATAGWTAFSGAGLTLNLGAVKPVRYYSVHSIQANIDPPENEEYAGMLLIQITRGNGTYAGKMGVLDVDAHSIMNRLGSRYEISDTL